MSNESLRNMKADFFEIANFSNVIGLVGGAQIPIKAPSTDEHLYVCRKGYHSLSVQIICNARLEITAIVSKWPGSRHAAFIWANCGLGHQLDI